MTQPKMSKTHYWTCMKNIKIYLQLPKILECDDGTKFTAECSAYFNDNGVCIRDTKAGRQQACVESVHGVSLCIVQC